MKTKSNQSTAKSVSISPTLQLTVTTVRETYAAIDKIDDPEKSARFFAEVIATAPSFEPDKETIIVILVDAGLKPFAWNLVALGIVNETLAGQREIFRPAIAGGAWGIVVMHNHPSNDLRFSEPDIQLTEAMEESSKILGVALVDHVIVPSYQKKKTLEFCSYRYEKEIKKWKESLIAAESSAPKKRKRAVKKKKPTSSKIVDMKKARRSLAVH